MPTILVVDDEPHLVDLLYEVLSEEGYTVACAANGQEALAMLAQTPVDLVLSALVMPLMNGVALCQTIQADPQYAHLPVVLMTGLSTSSECGPCTPTAVLMKPWAVDDILPIVARHVHVAVGSADGRA